jgi:hypothetical protein
MALPRHIGNLLIALIYKRFEGVLGFPPHWLPEPKLAGFKGY